MRVLSKALSASLVKLYGISRTAQSRVVGSRRPKVGVTIRSRLVYSSRVLGSILLHEARQKRDREEESDM